MRYLQILPLLMALTVAILSGFLGFVTSTPQKEILMQMVFVMVVFYILGLFTRSSVLAANEQLEKKKKERELEERKKREEKEKEEKGNRKEYLETLGQNVDLTANDEEGDSFDPLPVREFIKKELNQDEYKP